MELSAHIDFPTSVIKRVKELKVLFALDKKTLKHEAYIPMSLYLELLEEVEQLELDLAKKGKC